MGKISCAMMMDCCSQINFVSQSLVDALKLVVIEHPDPYKLSWQGKFVIIKHQVEVVFKFCEQIDVVVCDVLPHHMHVCTLILGQPWTKKGSCRLINLALFLGENFGFFIMVDGFILKHTPLNNIWRIVRGETMHMVQLMQRNKKR